MTTTMKVLIVEDNRTNLMLMEMLVRKIPGCRAITYDEPSKVVNDLATIDFDIAIVDYLMPGMNGIELIQHLRSVDRFVDKPVVMVTADDDASVRMQAIEAGVIEFLTKPIEPVEFRARIHNLARLCDVQKKLAGHAEWLRLEVERATQELRRREEEIINRLALAAGYKDGDTAAHTMRMSRYSELLARELGLSEDRCRDIRLASPMHDIGKVGIPDQVLLKQGALEAEERTRMQEHANLGAAILADSQCDLLRLGAEIALAHHERWDGTGYPAGLAGAAIPLSGRMAAVADVFDALTTARPYKEAWSTDRAFAYLQEQAGKQFDPACVDAFVGAREKVLEVMAAFPDSMQAARKVA
jgi:putative two-component system response regulator